MLVLQSKGLTASGQLVTGRGVLTDCALLAGSDAATAIVYDGTSSSGTVLAVLGAEASGKRDGWTAPQAIGNVVTGVQFKTGLYVALTGTSPHFVGHWSGV